METKPAQPPTFETCDAAVDNWHWDGKSLAQACSSNYPQYFTTDRGGGRGILWDVDYTWSYQFTRFTTWLEE